MKPGPASFAVRGAVAVTVDEGGLAVFRVTHIRATLAVDPLLPARLNELHPPAAFFGPSVDGSLKPQFRGRRFHEVMGVKQLKGPTIKAGRP